MGGWGTWTFPTESFATHRIFLHGLHFLLRGFQEQHMPVPAQLVREPRDTAVYHSTVYYRYTEFISKNNQHRFKDINLQNKVVRTFALPHSSRCVVKLLDLSIYLTIPKMHPFCTCVQLTKPLLMENLASFPGSTSQLFSRGFPEHKPLAESHCHHQDVFCCSTREDHCRGIWA